MSKQTKLSDKTHEQLTALSKKRKAECALNKSAQDIVAELINKQFKKEIKLTNMTQ